MDNWNWLLSNRRSKRGSRNGKIGWRILSSILKRLFGPKGLGLSIPLGSGHKVRIEDTDDMKEMKGITVSRDFNHAHPELIERFKKVSREFEAMCPGKKLLVTCTYRAPEYQRKLFKKGRFGNEGPIVTNCDGFNTKSKHNHFPSLALDVAVIVEGKALWSEALYYPLGPLCSKNGLEWGGYWTSFSDFPHLQLKEKPQEEKK